MNHTFQYYGRIGLLTALALCSGAPALAQRSPALASLINAYRAAPPSCEGRQARPMAPFATPAALASLQLAPGAMLDQALERAGYPVARAKVILIGGAADAQGAMDAIAQRYCRTLLSTQFSAVGAARSGTSWQIVLAQPALPPAVLRLASLDEAGQTVLDAVNAARAGATRCGTREFGPAAPLAWDSGLATAALAHSQDMALHGYFSHQDQQGGTVAERALAAGYRWRGIGENIAFGQETATEVVAGWLASPGHCANIMSPTFTQMGAAYAVDGDRARSRTYWTQVFGSPR